MSQIIQNVLFATLNLYYLGNILSYSVLFASSLIAHKTSIEGSNNWQIK